MGYVREWMPIQNAFEIRHETQSSRNLSQATKEDSRAITIAACIQVFRITRIANDGSGRNAAQLKRSGCEARNADHDVGRKWGVLETGNYLYLGSIRLQFGCQGAQPLRVARAKQHAFY